MALRVLAVSGQPPKKQDHAVTEMGTPARMQRQEFSARQIDAIPSYQDENGPQPCCAIKIRRPAIGMFNEMK
ncbi:hypothetical protein [Paracoccus seriniphilus]|uniref:hypothetical protein n=1 Tax=Paracoccus seriniphilus TaxID=184748 RepID=UPI000B77ECF0|nr:hypothetical protein [Paracoccus seriniphilus]WCR14798.1 hypothetical protein JHW44_04985 [Paracoccus seriniphilus]